MLLASVVLVACAGSPRRTGRGALRLDTETVSRIRHAAAVGEGAQEVEVDGCGAPITRAMLLGRQKHVLALQCAREVLEQLWPAPFSIEQRYRYYRTPGSGTVSRRGGSAPHRPGLHPGTVAHDQAGHRPACGSQPARAALILDFNFPAPAPMSRGGPAMARTVPMPQQPARSLQRGTGGKAMIISPQRGSDPMRENIPVIRLRT